MPTAKPLLRRGALFALGAALVAVLVCLWSRPVPPPQIPPLPKPNGYDDFVKAGRLLSGRFYDYWSMAPEDLRKLIAENAEALTLVRLGLTKGCRVPIDFSTNFFALHMPELASMKALCSAMVAEGRLAELENRPASAAQCYTDAIRFGHESSRGGFLINGLVRIACEGMALSAFEKVAHNLDADQARKSIQALEAIEARREDLQQWFDRDAAWCRRASGMQRLALMWAFKSFHPERANEQKCKLKFDTVEKRRRFLMIDLAARVYELEKGGPPRTITDLVPSYLKAIPQDQFTGTNLVYAFPSK